MTDLYYSACVLFMRVLQRDQSERPKIHAEPGVGTEWLVAIYIGDVPPQLAVHYARQAAGAATKTPPMREGEVSPDVQSRVGRGRNVEEALQEIIYELTQKLRARIASDMGAYEIAFGHPAPMPPPVKTPTPREDRDGSREDAIANRGMVKR